MRAKASLIRITASSCRTVMGTGGRSVSSLWAATRACQGYNTHRIILTSELWCTVCFFCFLLLARCPEYCWCSSMYGLSAHECTTSASWSSGPCSCCDWHQVGRVIAVYYCLERMRIHLRDGRRWYSRWFSWMVGKFVKFTLWVVKLQRRSDRLISWVEVGPGLTCTVKEYTATCFESTPTQFKQYSIAVLKHLDCHSGVQLKVSQRG